MRKIIFITNPISGAGSKDYLPKLIKKKCAEHNALPFFFPSVASGDYSFLIPIIKEEEILDVVIAGGDGTINQVVACLRHLPICFSILPHGSGNGLAFALKIPKSAGRALDILFNGNKLVIDAFLVNGQFACMLCGLGFDAQVAYNFSQNPKRGLQTYLKETLKGFFKAKPFPFRITMNGNTVMIQSYLFIIANSNQFGNNVTIAPKANLTDGLLDIVVLTQQSKIVLLFNTFLQLIGSTPLENPKKIDGNKDLIYFQTDEIAIENLAHAPMHIDGDPVEKAANIEIKIIPQAFTIWVPTSS